MRSKQFNILAGVTSGQRKEIRETIVQMVLATDMSRHSQIFGKFKSRIETDTDFTTKEDIRSALQIAIKMADVSNPSRPLKLYLKWSARICDEFYKYVEK